MSLDREPIGKKKNNYERHKQKHFQKVPVKTKTGEWNLKVNLEDKQEAKEKNRTVRRETEGQRRTGVEVRGTSVSWPASHWEPEKEIRWWTSAGKGQT